MIAVSTHEIEIVTSIIKKHAPNSKVIAFGSRYKGTHNPASDLDLAIIGDNINFSILANMKEDFMESDLPYKVDIIDYRHISLQFKEIVDSGHCEIYPK